MDNDNEDDNDEGKLKENVDISEELTTHRLVTWVGLAGIVNGQPHQDQGDQDHRKLSLCPSNRSATQGNQDYNGHNHHLYNPKSLQTT